MAQKPLTLQETIAALPAKIFKRDALFIVFTLVIGGGVAVWAQVQIDARLKGSVDGGVAPLRAELEAHVRNSNAVHATEGQAIRDLQADVAELRRQASAAEERAARRFEVLYNTVLERRPQLEAAELARPAQDGGR